LSLEPPPQRAVVIGTGLEVSHRTVWEMLVADVRTSCWMGTAFEHPMSVDPLSGGLRVRYVVDKQGEARVV